MASIPAEIYTLEDGRSLTLRTITGQDAPEVNPFFQKIAAESTHTMQYVGREYPQLDKVAERFESAIPDEITLNLGAFDGGRLVGYLNFRPYHAGHPWVRHLAQFGMMILKDYWGHGIGRELLRIQDEHARNAGVTRIEANVRVKNERGVRLYTKAGFRIEGTRKGEALIDGEIQDSYFIAKIFSSTGENDYRKADALLRREDAASINQALDILQKKTAEEPANAKAWFEYAGAYDFLGREAEALPLYQKTLDIGIAQLPAEDWTAGAELES